MEISKIIYYSRKTGKSQTLSLRELCLKDGYNCGLHTVFYAVRDSVDVPDLLEKFKSMCYESIEFDCEEPTYIRFKEIDMHGNINLLKFKKIKRNFLEAENEDY